MKLNSVEKALMNNPVRAMRQWRVEAPLLARLGGRVEGGRVLEVGCGRGVGTEIVLDVFGASHVDAVDLDPDQVALARRRLGRRPRDRWDVTVGDVTAVDAPDDHYDAVFDFGIVHHVPVWTDALAEIRRVLKPGGRFFFKEVTDRILQRWSTRTFTEHPAEDRFGGQEFVAELERQGFDVGDHWVERASGGIVFGVGTLA